MRRKSKNPVKNAKEKADRALQDAYRREYPDAKCEACGKPFRLIHHHIPKSSSLACRYQCPANFIFLCEKCHNQIHFYDSNPILAYGVRRGEKWRKEIIILARQEAPYIGIKKLQAICEYYKNNKPQKYE